VSTFDLMDAGLCHAEMTTLNCAAISGTLRLRQLVQLFGVAFLTETKRTFDEQRCA